MSLIGSVIERNALGTSNPKSNSSSSSNVSSGFPTAQHRSKSAFSQRRDKTGNNNQQVPKNPPAKLTQPTPLPLKTASPPQSINQLLVEIGKENEQHLDSLSNEQIEAEQKDIVEQFGGELIEKFKKRQGLSTRTTSKLAHLSEVPITDEKPILSRPDSPALSSPGTPRLGTPRQLRFAALGPQDVFVYPSAPSSPKKPALALPPPSEDDTDAVSLGKLNQWSTAHLDPEKNHPDPQEEVEGTPEYIRRRFFPTYPKDEPALEWISSPVASDLPNVNDSSLGALRFDLTGSPIASDKLDTLPTHMGLHHHADPRARAGYTLDDIFLLSRSTVARQRTAMVELLCGVSRWASLQPPSKELEEIRKRMLSVGILAMNERSPSSIVHGIELSSSCLLGWSQKPNSTLLDSEPTLPNLLVPIPLLLERDDLEATSKVALIPILSSLLFSRSTADTVMQVQNLVPALIRQFVVSAHPQSEAIAFFTQLSKVHRRFAQTLVTEFGIADILLRFFLESSHFAGHSNLLAECLNFYETLGYYGLGVNSFTRTPDGISALSKFGYWFSPSMDSDIQLRYLRLLCVYMVCAVDPHATTPVHSITWANIKSWGWQDELISLLESPASSLEITDRLLEAAATFCEVVNGNAPPKDREEVVGRFSFVFWADSWILASIQDVLRQCENHLEKLGEKDLKEYANVLGSFVRLVLACPPRQAATELFLGILDLTRRMVVDESLWTNPSEAQRALTTFLFHAVRLSLSMPSPTLGLPLATIRRFLPGDEELSVATLDIILGVITQNTQWHALGLRSGILKPFWMYSIEPWSIPADNSSVDKEKSPPPPKVAPYKPSPVSIKLCQTCIVSWDKLTLSSEPIQSATHPLTSHTRKQNFPGGLPLGTDWVFHPLDHLLGSATSPVFRADIRLENDSLKVNVVPSIEKVAEKEWNPNEREIVQACLTVAVLCQTRDQYLSRDEVLLGCMKVFMLEDGVGTAVGQEEIFRDEVVGRLMKNLISPFTPASVVVDASLPPVPEPATMERIHPNFFGFYTSFLALFDQISFGHPLFSALLLSPLAMSYPGEYRRLFWCDYSHVIKLVASVSPSEIPITATKGFVEWLWPLEDDNQVLGGLVRALTTTSPDQGHSFIRWLAIHHVSGNIWEDMWATSDSAEQSAKRDSKSSLMLHSLFKRCAADTLQEVVCYHRTPSSRLTSAGASSTQLTNELKKGRLHRAMKLLGPELGGRVEGFLHD